MNRVKVTHIFFGFGSPFGIGRALRGVWRPNPRRAKCHYRSGTFRNAEIHHKTEAASICFIR
jgi:hypothetical protein